MALAGRHRGGSGGARCLDTGVVGMPRYALRVFQLDMTARHIEEPGLLPVEVAARAPRAV